MSGIPNLQVNAFSSVKIVLGVRVPYLNAFFWTSSLKEAFQIKSRLFVFRDLRKGLGCNTEMARSGSRESFGTGLSLRLEEWAAGFP